MSCDLTIRFKLRDVAAHSPPTSDPTIMLMPCCSPSHHEYPGGVVCPPSLVPSRDFGRRGERVDRELRRLGCRSRLIGGVRRARLVVRFRVEVRRLVNRTRAASRRSLDLLQRIVCAARDFPSKYAPCSMAKVFDG